jgi:hypothetical protein
MKARIRSCRFYSKRRERRLRQSKGCEKSADDEAEDWSEYPVDEFRIADILFEVKILAPMRGRLYGGSDHCLWRSLELFFQGHSFGILDCESARLGIFKHCGAYYILDAYSSGPPIFKSGNGKAYLLRGACLRDLVTSLVLVIGSVECSPFTVRPVEISNVTDTSRNDDCSAKVADDAADCSFEAIRPKMGCARGKEDRKGSGGSRLLRPDDDKDKRKTICVPAPPETRTNGSLNALKIHD